MKIGFLLANRANWARSKTVIKSLTMSPQVSVVVFACSGFILDRYGHAVDEIKQFTPSVKIKIIHNNIEGETPLTQSLSTGILISQLGTSMAEEHLSCFVVVADRFEVIAGAISASYQNIPLIHIQGGEISGNIDDKVRNAVSAMADVHFPCTQLAFSRLAKDRMVRGQVKFLGCPAMDILSEARKDNCDDILKNTSHTGVNKKSGKPYNLIVYHPETENFDQALDLASEFFSKIYETSKQRHQVVLWPNNDAGSYLCAKALRQYREKKPDADISFYKHFTAEKYACVILGAQILVGNSSSFIREGEVLKKSAIIVGKRQKGRDLGPNVSTVENLKDLSIDQMLQEANPPVKQRNDYGNGRAGTSIANEILNFLSENR